ncbi:MAG: hypothetical protein JST40_05500 [Armatimonadetes bacterium]|nr:hypothetical protein [Armatimonadota bacterium]
MTDHLSLWKSDAEAMGIPENIQRGLAFLAGIDLVVNGAPVEKGHVAHNSWSEEPASAQFPG